MRIAKQFAAMTPEQLSASSRLFSSAVIKELARSGKSASFARLAVESGLAGLHMGADPVSDVFEAAFQCLKKAGVRHEYIYKAALTRKVLLGTHSLRTASMVTEFRVGACKADIVLLNGTSTAYEVKSERDSLRRLEGQVSAYSAAFARVYVVAAASHINAVMATVPSGVGVMELNRRFQISTVREALNRPEQTSPAAIFDSIRIHEACQILVSLGVTIPVVPNTRLSSVVKELFVQLDPVRAHQGMVSVLKRTRNLFPLSGFVEQMPPSLRTAALSIVLRRSDRDRLIAGLNTRLDDAMCWS